MFIITYKTHLNHIIIIYEWTNCQIESIRIALFRSVLLQNRQRMDQYENRQILVELINSADLDNNWWYRLLQSGKIIDNKFDFIFPLLNQVLGMHHEAMNVFWLESGCTKKHGNRYRLCLDVIESMKNEVDILSSFEVTKTRFGDHRHITFIKLDLPNETPTSIWKKHINNLRRIHPP